MGTETLRVYMSQCLLQPCCYPRPVLAFGYCRCLRLSISPSVTKFVRAITHYPFKLGSPNLNQRCKRSGLRSPLFYGTIDRELQGQIELQVQNLPHFELVHAITHHQLKIQFLNLEQKCLLALSRSLSILGLIAIWSSIQFLISNTRPNWASLALFSETS